MANTDFPFPSLCFQTHVLWIRHLRKVLSQLLAYMTVVPSSSICVDPNSQKPWPCNQPQYPWLCMLIMPIIKYGKQSYYFIIFSWKQSILIFRDKIMSSMSHDNFRFFHGNLKFLWYFDVKMEKIHIKHKISSRNLNFFTMNIYYSVDHCGINQIYLIFYS